MKNITWLISCAFLFQLLSPVPAQAQDQYFYPSGETITGNQDSDFAAGYRKIGIYEYSRATATTSWLLARQRTGNMVNWQLCDTHNSGFCADGSGYQVVGASILPPCQNTDQTNCIESLGIGNKNQMFPAQLDRQLPGFTFAGDTEKGIPQGSTVSIWKSPQFPHSGGDEYAIFSSIEWTIINGKSEITSFHLNVAATLERPKQNVGISTPLAAGSESGANGGSAECFYTATLTCAYHQVFAPETRIRVAVRLTNELSGWHFGRLKDPVVSVAKFSPDSDVVAIEAEPVTVPKLQTIWNQNEIPGLVDPVWTGNFGGGSYMTLATVPDAFRFIDSLRAVAKDTASGQREYWGVQSSKWTNQAGQRCFVEGQGLVGLVTTNAMAYQGGVPTFRSGFLNYEVAGMHLLPGGQKALGTYDLTMRSDVARCLYGFSKAPISATVTVSGSGEPNVATTVVGEKNGWLKLAAYGFTFSEKTISVKLTQKRTTITCVSTSTPVKTRKVSGLEPKCPRGFKKR